VVYTQEKNCFEWAQFNYCNKLFSMSSNNRSGSVSKATGCRVDDCGSVPCTGGI